MRYAIVISRLILEKVSSSSYVAILEGVFAYLCSFLWHVSVILASRRWFLFLVGVVKVLSS